MSWSSYNFLETWRMGQQSYEQWAAQQWWQQSSYAGYPTQFDMEPYTYAGSAWQQWEQPQYIAQQPTQDEQSLPQSDSDDGTSPGSKQQEIDTQQPHQHEEAINDRTEREDLAREKHWRNVKTTFCEECQKRVDINHWVEHIQGKPHAKNLLYCQRYGVRPERPEQSRGACQRQKKKRDYLNMKALEEPKPKTEAYLWLEQGKEQKRQGGKSEAKTTARSEKRALKYDAFVKMRSAQYEEHQGGKKMVCEPIEKLKEFQLQLTHGNRVVDEILFDDRGNAIPVKSKGHINHPSNANTRILRQSELQFDVLALEVPTSSNMKVVYEEPSTAVSSGSPALPQ